MPKSIFNQLQFSTVTKFFSLCICSLSFSMAHAQSQPDNDDQSAKILLNANVLLRASHDDLYERKVQEVVNKLKARNLPGQKKPTVVTIKNTGSGTFKMIITDDRRAEIDWAMQNEHSAVLITFCVFDTLNPQSHKQCIDSFYEKTIIMRGLLGSRQEIE